MKLLTQSQLAQLIQNGQANAERIADDGRTIDFQPVVKLFTPWGAATWLLTEVDPQDPDLAFGLCDLGMGCPEIGAVRLSDIASLRGPFGLTAERDLHFKATATLTAYTDAARARGRIVA